MISSDALFGIGFKKPVAEFCISCWYVYTSHAMRKMGLAHKSGLREALIKAMFIAIYDIALVRVCTV